MAARVITSYYLETELKQEQELFTDHFTSHDNSDSYINTHIKAIDFRTSKKLVKPVFSDTIIFNKNHQSYQLYKNIKFNISKEQKHYEINIIKSQKSIDLYIMIFSVHLFTLILILFATFFFINRQSIKSTLRVFYQTISQLKSFNINDQLKLEQETEIDEFRHLNKALDLMSNRIKKDFLNLKQYSENTSHELQTPLAILNAKLEELLQSENLTEKQLIEISGLISTVNRLSNINKALMFLTKIENRIFDEVETIPLKKIIKNQLDLYEDLIQSRSLNLKLDLKDVAILGNPLLVEALINNLIANSIKHNFEEGQISITLAENKLIIENTGPELKVSTKHLFNRFEKGNPAVKSLGIGLSIVKKICDVSQSQVQYESKLEQHKISIDFAETKSPNKL